MWRRRPSEAMQFAPSFYGLTHVGAAAILLTASGRVLAQSNERLYAMRQGGLQEISLEVRDHNTGMLLSSMPLRGVVANQSFFAQIACDGQRLWSVTPNVGPLFARISPVRQADAIAEELWSTGLKWSWTGLDVDPTTGRIYLFCQDFWPPPIWKRLYEYDPSGHYLTTIGGGIMLPFSAFVISASGQAFAFDAIGPDMYSIDLSSGQPTHMASLGFPAASGIFLDGAFDAAGNLWVSYEDTANSVHSGLYKIDIASLTHTKMVSMTHPPWGLAFGPAPSVATYCTAKISSQNCTPAIRASGYPCAAAYKGFTIQATEVPNQQPGMLIYSATGAQSLPFQGGTLCVAPPVRRTPGLGSGGNPAPANDCSGSFSIDFNTFNYQASSGAPPLPWLPAGTTVFAQWWGRDPGFSPPFNSMLSNALQFDLEP
jgi:hypothetical protein